MGLPRHTPDDPGNPTVDFHGEQRSNATHQSTTDPDARLARKGPGKEAKLCYAGHALMENRNGIAVNGCVTPAEGRAEPEAALAMVEEIPGEHRITLGGDKGYDRKEFVQELQRQGAGGEDRRLALPLVLPSDRKKILSVHVTR
jgi:hypothetical protein